MYDQNYLANSLRKASINADDRVFLQDSNTAATTSYGAFFARAEQMAAALVSGGVTPGDRVAVQAPKTQSMLELYVGTILAGAVFLPLNTSYTPSEVSYFLSDAAPAVLVCDPRAAAALSPIAQNCNVGSVLTLAADETGTLPDARDAQAPGFAAVARAADDLAAILYTSGTTGRSKGAMLSHGALASNSQVLRDYWQFTSDDVLIHALPIFHTHGLFVVTNISLMAGSKCIFMSGFDADAILDAMPEATALMGVPTFYVRLLDAPNLAQAARNMRVFISGSAPLLAETHDRWRSITGHAILERYGMTETNMNTSNPYAGDRRAGTVGFALPGIEVIITNPETGTAVAHGDIGLIEVRGPNVFSGYWNMPEKTAEELRENGFFITGDLGKFDSDGYLEIVGRSKDLVISGGYNIYPKEIEEVLDAIDGVIESAVIGLPHKDFGEAVVAVIVTAATNPATAEAIQAVVNEKLARFKHPKKIVFVDELPRNAMAKVQKAELRKTYATLLES